MLFYVVLVLVLFKDLVEGNCGFEEDDLVVILVNNERVHLFVDSVACFALVGEIVLELELVSVFKRPLIRVLKVNRDVDWKLAISRIVDLERMLFNADQRLRKALMDLELNLLDQETEVLLFHRVSGRTSFSESSDIATPLVSENPIFTMDIDWFPEGLDE